MKPEIASSLWNMSVCLGIAMMFGLSTYFCVRVKIFALLAVLIIGNICAGNFKQTVLMVYCT